jgi:transmembrane sensor
MGRDHLVLRTGVGERATATLADGSTVILNTSSVLEVNFSSARRDIRLVAGQVLFKVAHDTARPFIDAAADRQVIAVGTEFEVKLCGENVRVALLHGKIRVEPIAATAGLKTAVMAPGQELVATHAALVVKPADVEELVSWRDGRVRFDNTPLADAVAEMNRYSKTRIVIEDPAVSKIRITGAFRTGQSRSFTETVSEAFPVKAEQSGDVIRIQRRS